MAYFHSTLSFQKEQKDACHLGGSLCVMLIANSLEQPSFVRKLVHVEFQSYGDAYSYDHVCQRNTFISILQYGSSIPASINCAKRFHEFSSSGIKLGGVPFFVHLQ